jgi:hypothetical protein
VFERREVDTKFSVPYQKEVLEGEDVMLRYNKSNNLVERTKEELGE